MGHDSGISGPAIDRRRRDEDRAPPAALEVDRLAETKKEALSAFKRRVSDAVWHQLQVDLTTG